jgi:ATP-dependent RNA/DNA helicase IGHMBP2
MNGLLRNLRKSKDRSEQYQMRSSLKNLRKDLKERERKAVQEVLDRAQVIVCTNTVAADKRLDRRPGTAEGSGVAPFDVVVIDEAGQALEASCWIPILRGKKLVLAGGLLPLLHFHLL